MAVKAAAGKLARSLFDYVEEGNLRYYQDLNEVRAVPQTPLPRYEPPRGMPPKLTGELTPEAAQRLEETAQRGAELGGKEWYNLEPLRKAFTEELGEDAGTQAFGRYIDHVASTSPRSTVSSNI